MTIFYVRHADIDKEKWDRCIDNASNGLIYACSFYLDAMSENWDALVLGDYEMVMPLTWKRKYGIAYLRQPAFTQQLGIFSVFPNNSEITEMFISKALGYFSFMEINLNYANEYHKITAKKCNLILRLNRSFAEIEADFRKDFVKKIKDSHLIYRLSESVEEVIQLFKETYSERVNISKKEYEKWRRLCILLKNKKQAFVREVESPAGQLLSTALLLKDSRRIYYVMSTTLPAGRKQESNYFLLYNLVKEFSDQNLIFDFEGSEIPSIQLFFKKFGAMEQPYSFIRINHLSFLKKQLKRISDFYRSASKK